MKDINKDLKQDANILKFYKAKYFLVGFIAGIIPYVLIILLYDNYKPLANFLYFKEILLTIGICTAFINGFILQGKINKRLSTIFQINKGVKNNS